MFCSNSARVASPQGQSSVVSSFTSAPQRISARVRSGCAAANSIDSGPPSDTPISAADSEPDGVHHRAHVVHPLLERPDAHSIRETHPALVEQEETRERAEPLAEAPVVGVLPEHFQVRDRAGNEDEIRRPVAHDLVGDVHIVRFRVADRRRHRSSLRVVDLPHAQDTLETFAGGLRVTDLDVEAELSE